jgi:hypothetical protein
VSLIPSGTVVTVETKWFPPLTVDLAGAEGPPSRFVQILKPKVTLTLRGQTLASVAPGGQPVPNEWPRVKIGLAIAAGLLVFSVLRIFR